MKKRNRSLTKKKIALNPSCCNCGAPATCAHHIVPLVAGGNDTLENLDALCETCHGLIHGIDFRNHGELTRLGQQKSGRVGGRPPVPYEVSEKIINLRRQGYSYRKIATSLSISIATAHRYGQL